MQSASLRDFVLAGLLVSAAGCYSPYGYQSPYGTGPYSQPMYPSGPIMNTVPNGQPYVPGGSPGSGGLGGPTPLTAPGSGPGTGSGSSPSTYDNNSGNGIKFDDAPGFNANPNGSGTPAPSGGNRGTVPDPLDDTGSGPAASKPGLQPTSSIERDRLESAFEQDTTPAKTVQPANAAETEADPFFEPPQRLNGSVQTPGVIRKVSLEVPAPVQPKRLNPYGRDMKHANPEWLRGVIDYDAKQRAWQIVYSATPDGRDPNGGSLTLGNHPNLAECRSGDIVLVEGAINASDVDARGKPKYAIDSITLLTTQ